MSRAVANKLYNTFVKGLITEASPLTYPPDASINEDNTILYRKGNRSRRFGIGFEPDHRESFYRLSATDFNRYALKEFKWESAANQPNVNFMVHQVGLTLYFYDLSFDSISQGITSLNIDLTPYVIGGVNEPNSYEVSFASGRGYLFVVGERIEPLLVEYQPETQSLSVEQIYIQVRDFKGVDDNLANDEEPTTLTTEHHYNLRNQGWVSPRNSGSGTEVTYYSPFGQKKRYRASNSEPITTYFTILGRYPGNNKQWFVGKATANTDNYKIGDLNPNILEKFYFGNTRAPRGHFVVEAFNKDRSDVSGVPGIPVEPIDARPISVAFFAGRTWYLCNSTIYTSQVLDDKRKAGFCYQEADPTSEDISDLVATDGMEIPIPEMNKGVRMVASGSGIVVFGTNGIWFISGTQNGFSATDFSVTKINTIGTDSPNSIIEADGQIFWWSRIGIQGMAPKMGMFGPVEGNFDKVNISETTIQTFYTNDISDEAKTYVKALYDPATNTIQWLFKTGDVSNKYWYDRVLNFDLTLQAFYPWTISSTPDSPYICGAFITPRINVVETQINVVNDGNNVIDNGNQVIFNDFDTTIRNTFIRYLIAVPDGDEYYFTLGFFNNVDFADWQDVDGEGLAYTTFLETGYELLEDAMRDKQTSYVTVYFRRTEESYVPDGDNYVLDRPSSCYFQIKWDWASSSASNRWSTKVQAYRHTRLPQFSASDLTFDTGFPVVVTKNKVRGHGRAVQFRFENSEKGKDFDLLGWSVAYSGNQQP